MFLWPEKLARETTDLGANLEEEIEGRIPELHNLDEQGRLGPFGYYIRKSRLNKAAERRDQSNYYYSQNNVRKDVLPPWKYRRFDDDEEMNQ